LCGIKGYRLESFRNFGKFNKYNSIGTYFTIKAARSGLNIKQIKIEICPRNGVPRFGSGIRANFKILKALIIGIMRAR